MSVATPAPSVACRVDVVVFADRHAILACLLLDILIGEGVEPFAVNALGFKAGLLRVQTTANTMPSALPYGFDSRFANRATLAGTATSTRRESSKFGRHR